MKEVINYINKYNNEIHEADIPMCPSPYKLNDYEKSKCFVLVDEIDRESKEKDIQNAKTGNGFTWNDVSDETKKEIVGNTLLDFLEDYKVFNWMDDLYYRQQINKLYQNEKLKKISVYDLINIIGIISRSFILRTK